ncbi:lipase [Nocardioides psychrotolerans]|uniref:Pimeloyl-ACP methyl ester carboxylesterase n=1 Tax=Nocardioides psychrotolerans TaxID=1005945 RepID=A0A1I3BJT6_9ACTN|nr:alpha/beta hydrolase [Nocardioides psychrotolerans]GEP36606.1 lipase [Nocardioides psychrotolerans]SFH62366.1 Pimeloyl-ACP methyl ester carboxylesterase [Nocardioides psychrotolerans]
MSIAGRLAGAAAGALGLAAAGTVFGVVRRSRAMGGRSVTDAAFGSLRSTPVTVVAEDGVPLHVEVDEATQLETEPKRRWRRGQPDPEVTVVFAHGYCLNLDSWHFQRAAYRGLVRTVFYDHRSHGRSGRSPRHNATIEQLARDLKQILEEVVPDGPVVLVGHSMGGMTVVALAEQFPELVGDRVVGVALVSTTAGGLDVGRILLPMVPGRLGGRVTHQAVRTLHRGHLAVDGLRRAGRAIAMVATDLFAFGDEVPTAYVEFVDEMLSETPFEVVAEFFPSFSRLDKFHAVEVLSRVPTAILCGTADKLTSIGHSRKLHQRIAGSRLLECEGAGHMLPIERHDQVTAELDQLITAATARAAQR